MIKIFYDGIYLQSSLFIDVVVSTDIPCFIYLHNYFTW